jgi:DNA-binding transcriptional regulator GbsR (MarR family)
MFVAETNTHPKLSALESEIVDFFVQLSALLGQPRSFAEIYGLLFISPQPLTMDDLIERLELSKGSASQGLKFLREFGAVREVAVAGDRRTYYEAVAELRNLATRFLRDQFSPHLDSGLKRLDRIAALVKTTPAADRAKVQTRVSMLQSWGKRGKLFLPLVTKIMG